MAEGTNESAESNCACHASYNTAINGNVVGTEVVGTMSEIEFWLEVGVIPVPPAAAEIAPASVVEANTAFPPRQVTAMVETRTSSEGYMTNGMVNWNGSDVVVYTVMHANWSIVVRWGIPVNPHLLACTAASMTSDTSLSIYVNTCHHHGYHDHY